MQQVERFDGTITKLPPGKKYGEITLETGENLFFMYAKISHLNGIEIEPKLGWRIRCTKAIIKAIDERRGWKRNNEAIDIEVL